MPVRISPNPYHPTRDELGLTEPWTADEVRQAAAGHPKPLAAKAVPGSEAHRKLTEAGATAYQACPPLEVDATAPAVREWCEEHALLPVEPLEVEDLDELWSRWYEVIHRGWAPTAPQGELRALFAGLVAQIDPVRSVGCRVAGELVAVAFVFPGDDPEEILTEAMLPDHGRAREAVASCMAATVNEAGGTVRFDGHVHDPHFGPLWSTVPGVYAGENDPLDLLEIGGGGGSTGQG